MKKITAISISGLLLLTLLAGCSSNDKKNTSKNDQTEEQQKKNEGSVPLASGMKIVGHTDYGFVNIPENWHDVQDPNSPNELKFSDDSGTTITLRKPVETAVDATIDTFLEEAKQYHKNLGATSSEVTQVTIDGEETPCLTSNFESGVQMKSFAFVKNKQAHLLSIEGLPDNVNEASQWVEKTYRLTK